MLKKHRLHVLNHCLKLWLIVESITFLTDAEQPPLSSSSVVGHVSVFVPMKGLIDPKAELARLQKRLR